MQEVAPGIYVEGDFEGGNVGMIVTGEGVVLIDTPMMPWEARKWADMVRKTTSHPVRFVINTDHHVEKSLGNQFFPVPVIGHESGWKEMTGYSEAYRQRLLDSLQVGEPERDAELKQVVFVSPTITLTDKLTLFVGDKTLHLMYIGGHSVSSILVYVPQDGVLLTGDVVVNGVLPVLAQANSKMWLDALTRIRRMSFDVLVPGRGAPGGKEMTLPVSTFIRDVRSGVRRHCAAGRSKAETYNQMLDLLNAFPIRDGRRERIEQQFKVGINQVYEEMKTEKGNKS